MTVIDKMHIYYDWMCNRKTATYRNGKIDFSHGEGGNNHIHVFDNEGVEIGYIWFDTHVGCGMPTKINEKLAFCGKCDSCCRGIFKDIIIEWFKHSWERSDSLFYFTPDMFVRMMEVLVEKLH